MTPLELDLGWLVLTGVTGYLLGKGFSEKTRSESVKRFIWLPLDT